MLSFEKFQRGRFSVVEQLAIYYITVSICHTGNNVISLIDVKHL